MLISSLPTAAEVRAADRDPAYRLLRAASWLPQHLAAAWLRLRS